MRGWRLVRRLLRGKRSKLVPEEEVGQAYDEVAQDYLLTRTRGEGFRGFQNREIEQPIMFSLVPRELAGLTLLDVGCGPGIHLEEYVKRGARTEGVDPSEQMIALAKERSPESGLRVGTIYELPFPGEAFDVVTASFVLGHVADLGRAVAEVKRVLKKGGSFIYSVPHPIVHMFRRSKKGEFLPSHSYYDDRPIALRLVRDGRKIPDHPRILEEHFRTLLAEGFTLVDFVENKPHPSWGKHEWLDENWRRVPCLCFFKWKKS